MVTIGKQTVSSVYCSRLVPHSQHEGEAVRIYTFCRLAREARCKSTLIIDITEMRRKRYLELACLVSRLGTASVRAKSWLQSIHVSPCNWHPAETISANYADASPIHSQPACAKTLPLEGPGPLRKDITDHRRQGGFLL